MTRKAPHCKSKTAAGKPCKVPPLPGSDRCQWHSKDPSVRAKRRESSSRGGKSKAYGALPVIEALAQVDGLKDLNLETAEGLRTFLAHTLRALGRLPFDVRVANSVGQLVTAQRAVVETSSLAQRFEQRLAALETAVTGRPVRVA